MAAHDCDVLIVGLGPVGATLAALLGQRGIATIAIDRDTAIYPLPRAVHFDHEIMRLFQALGIADPVSQAARDLPAYEFRAANGDLLMRLDPQSEAPSGWGSGYMFHQPSLEVALRDILASLPHTRAMLGARFDGLTQDAEGVTASVTGPDGAKAIRARYLVGCDGASSGVRAVMGAGLTDYQFDEPWLVVDTRTQPTSRMPQVNLQICDPARPTTCVLGGPGRHRWEFMLLPGETPDAMLRDAVIQGLLASWDCGPLEIERKAVYRFHGLVADRWRAGRVFLAGDSAHQMPPFAGQGMCSGLRDAANLAWKLHAVLAGKAGDGLLDTYQPEREPHVRALVELAIGMGRVVCTLDKDAAAARDAGMLASRASGAPPLPPLQPAPLASDCILAGTPAAGTLFPQPTHGQGADRLRMDDLLGDGAWLIARHGFGATTPGLRIVACDHETLAPFRAALDKWLGKFGADAVLVRPDRIVFGTGAPAALAAAWTAAMGSP
ncbi:MAG TPA: bifunctional 3-(3-hydroxy-phenyl)propionate/3-hydroxycinnamic acid hydroxylase [Rhizomicrobium sp.]|jgi:3-(3-hydroxy-phenyl)propionate hydroxylase|nr:bifunctional 3-(3-hydroxy-phenyl)propionate/3-hydroxycinnamic acid hydroxylase [Rhizomicrobium sp.]